MEDLKADLMETIRKAIGDREFSKIRQRLQSGSLVEVDVLVTPEMAEAWLAAQRADLDHPTRRLREGTARRYAKDMLNDQWHWTLDPVRFNREGRLFDGQHRMRGVMIAETPTKMRLNLNVRDEVMPVIDSGIKRTAADALKHEGFVNTSLLASVARRLLAWETGAFATVGATAGGGTQHAV